MKTQKCLVNSHLLDFEKGQTLHMNQINPKLVPNEPTCEMHDKCKNSIKT